MKLVIQIPCLNEEETLGRTLADLPRELPGFDEVEWLVVDDGSTDATARVAREAGADHLVSLRENRGLARAFVAGLDASLAAGADVIVNTDGDAQYSGAEIAALVAPIVAGRADIVVGDRRTSTLQHFSFVKRRLQAVGSWMIRRLSGTEVPDATCGFRAISRAAAQRTKVYTDFTYTLETLIQAGHLGLVVAHVPVLSRPATRESRLFRTIPGYVARSVTTVASTMCVYRPVLAFVALASAWGVTGLGLGVGLHSLALAIACTAFAALLLAAGAVAHLAARKRRVIEESNACVRYSRSSIPRTSGSSEERSAACAHAVTRSASPAEPRTSPSGF